MKINNKVFYRQDVLSVTQQTAAKNRPLASSFRDPSTGQLSLLTPVGGEMNTGQIVVMCCGWEVKTGQLIPFADKRVVCR